MSARDRFITAIVTLAATLFSAIQSRGLLLKLSSTKWTTPFQPHCLKLSFVFGAALGIVIGCLMFYLCLRCGRNLIRSIVALFVAAMIAAVVGAIIPFMVIGSTIWPPEIPHGFDPDNLIGFGFAGSIIGAVFSTGMLAACIPIQKK